MTRVTVVIPSWNGEKLLKSCLGSLEDQTYRDFETVVVDNGSTDQTTELVRTHFPRVKLIRLGQNLGFATAVNRGILMTESEYLILLNNDTKVDPRCLSFLVRTADEFPEAGMVAAKMLNFFDPQLIDGAGGYIDAVGHANTIGYGKKDGAEFREPREVFLVSGGGSLIKRWVFNTVGLFDEDYFAYFEDVDLCLRAQLQGISARFEPKAVIYHIHKATSSKNKALTEYLQFRNLTQTVIKNYPREFLENDFNWLKIILVNINTVRFLMLQGYLISALKAEWFVLVNIIKLLRKRRIIQSQIKVPCSYLVENIKPKKVTLFGILTGGF